MCVYGGSSQAFAPPAKHWGREQCSATGKCPVSPPHTWHLVPMLNSGRSGGEMGWGFFFVSFLTISSFYFQLCNPLNDINGIKQPIIHHHGLFG